MTSVPPLRQTEHVGDRCPDHRGSAGTEMIVLSGDRLRRFTFRRDFFSFSLSHSAMAVLTIHKFLRTLALTITSLRTNWKFRFAAHYTYKNGKRRLRLHRMCPILAVSNRIATLGAARDTSLEFLVQRSCRHPRAGDGTSLFVTLWEFEVKPEVKNCLSVHTGDGEWRSSSAGCAVSRDAAAARCRRPAFT